jgi:RHS repeat-associated protein
VTVRDEWGVVVCTEAGATGCPLAGGLPFGFHTAWRSAGTGLLYFRNRWYAPHLGQWLSQDALGAVDSHDLYAFNGFDPVNFVDPWGLEAKGPAKQGQKWETTIHCAENGWTCAAANAWRHAFADLQFEHRRDEPRAMAQAQELVHSGVAGVTGAVSQFACSAVPLCMNQPTKAPLGDADEHQFAFDVGRVVGAVSAASVGMAEVVSGVGLIGGGVPALATGVGTAPGAGAIAMGSAAIVHGVAMVVAGAKGAAQAMVSVSSSSGRPSSAGETPPEKPPTPEPASPSTQEAGPGENAAKGAGRGSEARGLKQPDNGTFFVDPKGNAIPTPPGGKITGSPDGRFIQARDAAGNPTGVRLDGPHNPKSHPDPRAQQPHGHVPGVTNPDGTPWLPVK